LGAQAETESVFRAIQQCRSRGKSGRPVVKGGLICLSTYIAELPGKPFQFQPANQSLSIMIGHGTRDAVVPIMMAESARQTLEHMGFTPDWQSYPIQHEVCFEEADDIAAFIHRRIGMLQPH